MNDWLLFYGAGTIIFLSWLGLYWYMRNKFDDLMTLQGRSLSFSESQEKAKEIDEFLESIDTGEKLEVKYRNAGLRFRHGRTNDTASFIQTVHLLGCEVVIRQVDTEDIEYQRVTKEVTEKHLEWLCSTERYLRRKVEEEEGFSQY